jgi:hypothetical protein
MFTKKPCQKAGFFYSVDFDADSAIKKLQSLFNNNSTERMLIALIQFQ